MILSNKFLVMLALVILGSQAHLQSVITDNQLKAVRNMSNFSNAITKFNELVEEAGAADAAKLVTLMADGGGNIVSKLTSAKSTRNSQLVSFRDAIRAAQKKGLPSNRWAKLLVMP